MGEGSKVYGIEHIPELAEASKENICKHHKQLLDSGSIIIVNDDGRKGLAEYAPYDVIHIGAAVKSIPGELIEQLAPGGTLVMLFRLQTTLDGPCRTIFARNHYHAERHKRHAYSTGCTRCGIISAL